MKHILYFAVATIAIGLMTPAAHAQRSDLDLRFHVPFPFSVADNTFAAGDYMVTRLGHLKLIFFNQENRTAASVSVLPASSHKYWNGHARVVFHRYDSQYFLAIVSEGSLDSTFGVYTSKEETQLANASPQKPVTTVSVVPSRGAMDALTNKYLKIAASRDYLAPDALNSDPLDQRLLTCWHSLASTAASNQFVDDGACQ